MSTSPSLLSTEGSEGFKDEESLEDDEEGAGGDASPAVKESAEAVAKDILEEVVENPQPPPVTENVQVGESARRATLALDTVKKKGVVRSASRVSRASTTSRGSRLGENVHKVAESTSVADRLELNLEKERVLKLIDKAIKRLEIALCLPQLLENELGARKRLFIDESEVRLLRAMQCYSAQPPRTHVNAEEVDALSEELMRPENELRERFLKQRRGGTAAAAAAAKSVAATVKSVAETMGVKTSITEEDLDDDDDDDDDDGVSRSILKRGGDDEDEEKGKRSRSANFERSLGFETPDKPASISSRQHRDESVLSNAEPMQPHERYSSEREKASALANAAINAARKLRETEMGGPQAAARAAEALRLAREMQEAERQRREEEERRSLKREAAWEAATHAYYECFWGKGSAIEKATQGKLVRGAAAGAGDAQDDRCKRPARFDPRLARLLHGLESKPRVRKLVDDFLLPEISPAGRVFLQYMEDLRVTIQQRLNRCPREQADRDQLLRKVFRKRAEAEVQLKDLRTTLHDKRVAGAEDLKSKREELKQYELKIKELSSKYDADLIKRQNACERDMVIEWRNSEYRQRVLEEELAELEAKLEEVRKANLEEEREMRVKHYKYECTLESMLQAYDNDMADRQAELDRVEKALTEQRKRQVELKKKLRKQEPEYQEVVEERRQREERDFQRRIFEWLCQRAARRIQRCWRSFRERQAEKKKRRRRKK